MPGHQQETEFEQRIRQHEGVLHKICRLYAFTKADRQDLFQEMVLQLWRSYPKFSGASQFSTWMYRVALNTAITGLRKKRIVTASLDRSVQEPGDDTEYADQEERFRQMYAAIEQLGEIEKAIVMLYMEDRSYQDMQDILGISEGNLRVKMTRIKDKLRQITQNQ